MAGAGLASLNLSPSRLVGASLYDFFGTENPDALAIAAHRRALEGDPVSYTTRWSDRIWQVRVDPYFANARQAGVVGVALDITEQQGAEQSLEQRGEQYRRLVELSPDAMLVHSQGRVVFVNTAGARLFGAAERELLVGRDTSRLIHPESRSVFSERLRQILESGVPGPLFEARFQRLDGSEFIAEVSSAPASWEGAPAMELALREVTERIQAQREREAHLALFAALIDNMRAGVLVETEQRRIFAVNAAFCDIFAIPVPPRELVGADCARAAQQVKQLLADPEAFPARIDELVRRRKLVLAEELRFTDGRVYERDYLPIFSAERKFIGHMWQYRDVSQRKRAEQLLRDSEERYRVLFEEDLAGNFVSTPDGRLLACNAAFANIFGFASVDAALRCDLRDLYPDRGARQEMLERVRRDKRIDSSELELRRTDGTPVYVMETLVGVFDERGELTEMRGYLLDITERKQLEQQLRQSQKMEAVGRLAGGVAHDFNNLLTAIRGYGEMLLGEFDASDPRRKDIEEIKNAAERATSLTRQLLAFSRRQMLELRPVDLNSVVLEMDKLVRRLIGEDIELITILEPELRPVRGDPGQIEQVILNLVVNARDAMPQGGRLTIETANVDLDRQSTRWLSGLQPGAYGMLVVSDTGHGMDQEVLAHLFEPFFTTKERGKGTGLGLSTVYGIVRQSGGQITARSELGHGTSFRIYLPQLQEAPAPPPPKPAPQKAQAGSETILVVEDQDAVRSLARRVLQQHGYRVLEARHGGEALRVAQELEGPLHLLLTDIVMPEMGGHELVKRMASLRPDTKVLFMSGYTDQAFVHYEGYDAATAFLEKPFTPHSLALKVR
ncbi:MAG: PAS domain S-box protein, partial [Gemmatimonadetes bacterium]|nr:PAS domain S-box protein [Gemmatimonadota bacterium]